MDIILGILFGFVAICIIALILLQESKGGGIAAMGVPGMDNIIGARNPLRRLTIYFGIAFLLLMLGINVTLSHQQDQVADEDVLKVEPAAEVPATGEPAAAATEALPADVKTAPAKAVPAAATKGQTPPGEEEKTAASNTAATGTATTE